MSKLRPKGEIVSPVLAVGQQHRRGQNLIPGCLLRNQQSPPKGMIKTRCLPFLQPSPVCNGWWARSPLGSSQPELPPGCSCQNDLATLLSSLWDALPLPQSGIDDYTRVSLYLYIVDILKYLCFLFLNFSVWKVIQRRSNMLQKELVSYTAPFRIHFPPSYWWFN